MNPTQTHVLRLPRRTMTVTVTEYPAAVRVRIRCDAYGRFGDDEEIKAFLAPIFRAYETDPRPFLTDSPHTGQIALVDDAGAVIVTPTPNSKPGPA